jgi:hypothetical protein
MLIRHDIILVFGVEWLIVRRDVDLVVRKLIFAEVFEEVGISRAIKVYVGVV